MTPDLPWDTLKSLPPFLLPCFFSCSFLLKCYFNFLPSFINSEHYLLLKKPRLLYVYQFITVVIVYMFLFLLSHIILWTLPIHWHIFSPLSFLFSHLYCTLLDLLQGLLLPVQFELSKVSREKDLLVVQNKELQASQVISSSKHLVTIKKNILSYFAIYALERISLFILDQIEKDEFWC